MNMKSVCNQNNSFAVYLNIKNQTMQFATEEEAREYIEETKKENEKMFSDIFKKEIDKIKNTD